MINQKWGRIIHFSSIVGNQGAKGAGIYAASKSALVGYSKTLSKEYGRFGITSNIIELGYFEKGIIETFNQEILMNKINTLFSKFNNEIKDIFEIIKKRYKFPFEIDDFSCFQILFSWENLETTHLFFQNYFKNKKINKNIISKHLLNI